MAFNFSYKRWSMVDMLIKGLQEFLQSQKRVETGYIRVDGLTFYLTYLFNGLTGRVINGLYLNSPYVYPFRTDRVQVRLVDWVMIATH